jgi:hypothetical protein
MRRLVRIAAWAAVLLAFAGAAGAQTTAPSGSAGGATAPAPAPLKLPAGACPTWPLAGESGTPGKFAVLLGWGTPWQPRDGVVRFSVLGHGFTPASLVACYRVVGAKDEAWALLPGLHLEKAEADETSYTFRVPSKLTPEPPPVQGGQIEVRMTAIDAAGTLLIDTKRSVQITSVGLAGIAAVAWVILAGLAVGQTRRARTVPGKDWVLSLIAGPDGRASLSQAQIMLWSFVISGAAVFVLTLSGNLVEIGDKVLWLLGISGVAVVGAKVKDAPKIEGGLTAVPAAVTALAAAVKEDSVRLSWTAPPGDWRSVFYVVTRERAPGKAEPVVGRLLRPSLRVTGLPPGQWTFRVIACNAAGSSAEASVAVDVPGAPALPEGALPKPADLRVAGKPAQPLLEAGWAEVPGAEGYALRYRPRASDVDWTEKLYNKATLGDTLGPLLGMAQYDVEVRAIDKNGARGAAAAADAVAGPREPRWSDLLIDDEGTGEINVTRVQMLFFTVVTAGYVVLSVVRTQVVPDIPESILLLMGISNGVYLTAKFVPKP